jgi:hypothetical protein
MPELPKCFWPSGHGSVRLKRVPRRLVEGQQRDPVLVANVKAALWQMDPCDWRGDHKSWFELLMACKFVGISLEDFVEWSTSDPDYADEGDEIARQWRSVEPKHGGALWRELSARGIKVRQPTSGLPPKAVTKTINWWTRLNSVLNKLAAKQDDDMLFWSSCRAAEIMADTGKPKPSVAVDLLVGAVSPIIKRDEALRVIMNAFDHVEYSILGGDAA